MMRGTFANIRIKNQMLDNVEGKAPGAHPDRRANGDIWRGHKVHGNDTPLVVLSDEYGTGSRGVTGPRYPSVG